MCDSKDFLAGSGAGEDETVSDLGFSVTEVVLLK